MLKLTVLIFHCSIEPSVDKYLQLIEKCAKTYDYADQHQDWEAKVNPKLSLYLPMLAVIERTFASCQPDTTDAVSRHWHDLLRQLSATSFWNDRAQLVQASCKDQSIPATQQARNGAFESRHRQDRLCLADWPSLAPHKAHLRTAAEDMRHW